MTGTVTADAAIDSVDRAVTGDLAGGPELAGAWVLVSGGTKRYVSP
ncbi:MAG: hypothetical protein ABJB47_01130 [Actinomycetota bacterium]